MSGNGGGGSRRDLTPTGFRIPQANTVELTAEELNLIVRDSAACLRKTEELAEQVVTLKKSVEDLTTALTQGRTLVFVGRWLIGLVASALIGAAGWLYSEQRTHDVRLTRMETVLVAQTEAIERAERVSNMSTQDRSRMRGDIQAMRASLDELRHNVSDIRTDVREIRARQGRH